MPISTQSVGMSIADITIRSAILEGLETLRAKPYLLDYCFAGLNQDTVTEKLYGQKSIDRAKEYFLANQITVVLSVNQEPQKFPVISIKLTGSTEDKATLGDTHYEPYEDSTLTYPTLYGPFVADYAASTGKIVVPLDIVNNLILCPGQIVFDDQNQPHPIISVLDPQTVQISPNLNVSFQNARIKGQSPPLTVSMESVWFNEQFQIGVHAQGDPEVTLWIWSVVKFILLAFKETLLESRNYELSTFTSTDLVETREFENDGQLVYSRFINLSGLVRHQWPKSIDPKITGVVFDTVIDGAGELWPNVDPLTFINEPFFGDEDRDPLTIQIPTPSNQIVGQNPPINGWDYTIQRFGPYAWYKMNETAGPGFLHDSSGNSRDLEIPSGTNWIYGSPGIINGDTGGLAMQAVNGNSYARSDDVFSISGDYTLVYTFKHTDGVVVDSDYYDSVGLEIPQIGLGTSFSALTAPIIAVGDSGNVIGPPIDLTKKHLVILYGNLTTGAFSVDLDGVLYMTGTLHLGTWTDFAVNWRSAACVYDDVAVFNRQLAPTERNSLKLLFT